MGVNWAEAKVVKHGLLPFKARLDLTTTLMLRRLENTLQKLDKCS